MVLQREIHVPEAAENDLHRWLEFELDRYTPFPTEAIVWSGSVRAHDPAHRQIVVELAFLPRAQIQPVVSALLEARITVTRIVSVSTAGSTPAIELAQGRKQRRQVERCVDALALGCCGLLTVAAAILPFILQANSRAHVENRILDLRPLAAEVDRLRHDVTRDISAASALAEARQQLGSPLRYLTLLSAALPDDTYITMLSAHQHTVMINGRSAHAAGLVASLASHPFLRDPALSGITLRNETSQTELFSLSFKATP